MKIKPNYYAVLIADVRYNKDLTPNAKLLYAEITALSNMNGKCFASNKYFSELYGKSKTSISKWISQLVAFGYVSVAYTYIDGTKCIDKRYITILNNGIKENLNTPIKENLKDNTTSNNITNNNIYIKEKFINQVMILDCNEEIKQDFIDYWTEGNNKMRYQKQPTFDVNLRLKRWIKNSVKWNTKKQGTSKLDKQIDEWQKAKELLEKI